jgi:hypothetical protein
MLNKHGADASLHRAVIDPTNHIPKDFRMSKRAEYIEKMELQLDKLNKKMLGLEVSAQEAKEEARQKYKEEMAHLRQKSQVAAAKLDEMKAAGIDSWEHMVTDMEKMHDAFTHSFMALFRTPGASEDAPTSATADRSNAHKTV